MKKLTFLLAFLAIQLISAGQDTIPTRVENINTYDGDEIVPIITIDGKTMYFCGENRDDNLGFEDVYVSHLVNGHWSKPVIDSVFSTPDSNEVLLDMSPDGNTAILFINGHIYKRIRTTDGWSKPILIQELNFKPWNSDISISSDGNAIFFAAGEKNFFTMDINIYVIEKQPDGSWSAPKMLPSIINAGSLNRSPFIHPDMKTLYFATNGYNDGDNLDIYKTIRLDSTTWDKWSKPIKLSFNTSSFDWAFRVTPDGKTGYFCRNGNIYKVNLKKDEQANKIITITGIVKNDNGEFLNANVNWEDLETGEKLGELETNPQNGQFIIALPPGKNYGIYFSKQGYYPTSFNIDLRSKIDTFELKKTIVMHKIKDITSGKVSIKLNNVFFENNSYKLKKESFSELNRLADFIKAHPNLKIEIAGHTDNVGSEQYNLALSKKRANAVKRYLISQGCNPNQLITKGYGESKPVADNSTEEGKRLNRRVEFKVISL